MQHVDRQERQKKLEEDILRSTCSFKPQINNPSSSLASPEQIHASFLARNSEYVNWKKKQQEQREQLSLIDEVDGKRLFSPRILAEGRVRKQEKIENHLLSYKDQYEKNVKKLRKEEKRKNKEQNHLQLCPNSSRILADSFVENLASVFKQLDSKNNE